MSKRVHYIRIYSEDKSDKIKNSLEHSANKSII